MSIHLGRLSTYPCLILYTVSKQDQTNDIHFIIIIIIIIIMQHVSVIRMMNRRCI